MRLGFRIGRRSPSSRRSAGEETYLQNSKFKIWPRGAAKFLISNFAASGLNRRRRRVAVVASPSSRRRRRVAVVASDLNRRVSIGRSPSFYILIFVIV